MVKRKKGTKRDKNAPKRPPTAFFLFCKERREHVREQTKKEDPKSGVVEVARKLGEIWRNLSDQDKDKYVKLAVIEKGKYDLVRAKYLKMKAAESGPKRPPTSFFLFAKECRPKIKEYTPDFSTIQVAQILGEEWRNMDNDTRAKYQTKSLKLKKEYDIAKIKWLKKVKKSTL